MLQPVALDYAHTFALRLTFCPSWQAFAKVMLSLLSNRLFCFSTLELHAPAARKANYYMFCVYVLVIVFSKLHVIA